MCKIREGIVKKIDFNLSVNSLKKIYLGGFFLLCISLFYYQIIQGDYYYQRAKNNYVRVIPLRAIRGTIFDRNGVSLAYDKATFNISVIPYQIKHKKDFLFKQISEFLDYNLALIYKNYNKNLQNFFSPVDIITAIDKEAALELKGEFGPAIIINVQPQRYYIYPYQFAHLLGYVKEATAFYESLKKYGYTPLERVGFKGIEQYYDAYLKGKDGGELIEIDVQGRVVGFLGTQLTKKGKDIFLTVDSRIQKIATQVLGEKKGVIILMNSENGEIIALYSSPSFDPNYFVSGKDVDKFLNNQTNPLLNRAVQAVYPIGSLFKPLIGVGALEEKKATPSTTFKCNAEFKLGIASFSCWNAHGEQNLYEALIHSCNIYFYNLGLILGPDSLSKWAKKFGLDSVTGIDLPYEKKGFIPDPRWKKKALKKDWFAGDTVNFSIGQGFLETTPLEILIAINVFASGGYLVTPHILQKVEATKSGLLARTYLGISDKNLEIIKKSLRGVVSEETGTAHILERLGLELSGKTGTAQTKTKPHGWFVGFFPYKKPLYTICVFLENGGSSYEAVKVTYNFLKKLKEEHLL